MDPLDLARWQFGITTVYHFLFVPVTIGLSLLVAILNTVWVRTGKVAYLRATKFWGTLFLINFAMGVVTGIVQEFQFGMNWSSYSRFVGDIFGAPLALEALLAFFLESTFLGLWLFGWNRLPKLVHLACIWLVAIGTTLSAYFILAANSFMQWPVGFKVDGRAELVDFGEVLTNKVLLAAFPHTIVGSWLSGGAILMAVSAWHVARKRDLDVFRPCLRLGAVVVVLGAFGTLVTGDVLGKVMTQTQPMKMAAAEALYQTEQPAPFSLFTIGTLSGTEPVFQVTIPGVLSQLATGSFDGKVHGINDIQAEYQKRFGPGDYRPFIPVAYWGFRLMIGFGMLAALVALAVLWLTRKGGIRGSGWMWSVAVWSVALPFLAHSFGWIFTEMARQPWIVFSQMKTADGVSPSVGGGTVLTSLIVFTALYGALALVELGLMIKYGRKTPPSPEDEEPGESGQESFAY
ncbi:cytochrome ubiquinol oxidase subunit I [Nonomuraea cavernae]|uniref:Cytochrome ubiquinol oxidase subunit I n=1 Tax=Nonomuraea cavernae TaxID=2045107 RepID=A0A918DEC7_9ACTN|nr:cytochrome ubiquinol oxidase subunit I [Nonomuraea cavernae]MCA2183647.1 cytochrome ubiquinol oxidase subunit I [Nonomuraea cavernae]GGO60931.1 cytochrome ubiquinol oxidase subunit I [Nonomuraea cavernae]